MSVRQLQKKKGCPKRKEEGGVKKALTGFLSLKEVASLKADRYMQR